MYSPGSELSATALNLSRKVFFTLRVKVIRWVVSVTNLRDFLLVCYREEADSIPPCPMGYMDLPSGILYIVHDADDLEFILLVSPIPSHHELIVPVPQTVCGYVHL